MLKGAIFGASRVTSDFEIGPRFVQGSRPASHTVLRISSQAGRMLRADSHGHRVGGTSDVTRISGVAVLASSSISCTSILTTS